MDKLKRITVAIDFSASSRDALAQAQRLAAWSGNAEVRGVHVVNIPSFTPMAPALLPAAYQLPSQAQILAEARERLSEFERALPPGTTMPPLDVEQGTAVTCILERSRDSDLLVMGAHGEHDERRGVGATAAACVRRATCPVLLVRRGSPGPFTRIVACVDFSDTSKDAVDKAIRIAAQDDATLMIAHAYDDPWAGRRETPEVPDFRAAFKIAVEDRLRTFCEPLAHELRALKATYHGVEQSSTRGGRHAYTEALVRFINDQNADLAVLGTRSKWSPRDFLIGSTAERVVRDAGCALLAIRPVKPAQG